MSNPEMTLDLTRIRTLRADVPPLNRETADAVVDVLASASPCVGDVWVPVENR
ncbi:hypothetical protein [Georgenia deserti]|uniref:Uncharacterized protein n=1 Tax=Georgenia deserti TaxID=2093781 RepID=A0ABW4LA28_9MICO